MKSKRVAFAFAVLGVAALVACGGDESEESSGPLDSAAKEKEAGPPPAPVDPGKSKAPASLCKTSEGETVLFACTTTAKKIISVCGYKGAAQYRYGVADKIELKLPEKMTPTFDKPEIAEQGTIAYSGGGATYAAFHNGNFDYVVFTKDVRTNFKEGETNDPEHSAGVQINEKGKEEPIALIECAGTEEGEGLTSEIIAPARDGYDPGI